MNAQLRHRNSVGISDLHQHFMIKERASPYGTPGLNLNIFFFTVLNRHLLSIARMKFNLIYSRPDFTILKKILDMMRQEIAYTDRSYPAAR